MPRSTMTCEMHDSFDDALGLDREEFARLYSSHARRLYSFIMTLTFNHQDAEDVFQNTSVVLWNKLGDFVPGTNFFAWASRIAYFEALRLMKQQRRGPMLSDESLQLLANEAIAMSDRTSARIAALDDCLARLTAADREMIVDRYYHQQPPKQLAARRSRSLDSIYRALSRIHNSLLTCVQRSIAQEEGA
jgi:RNA polymerase sigma-70 factor, ECF subfamily